MAWQNSQYRLQQAFPVHVIATQAKNRFTYVCAQAKVAPVFIEKNGRIDSVILSVQDFEALKAASQTNSLAERQKAFHQTHKAWLVEQNARFEKNGLWCDDLRVG